MTKEDESHLKFLGVHAEVIEFMKQNTNNMNILINSIEFKQVIVSGERAVCNGIVVKYTFTDYPNKIEGEYTLSSKTTILDLDKIKELIIADLKSVGED